MKVGYAYSSDTEHTLEMQIKRLQELGCDRIYQETIVGVRSDRPKLKKCLDSLRADDTFIVCRLDCIGTQIEKVLLLLYELVGMGVTFISLDDNLNTEAQKKGVKFGRKEGSVNKRNKDKPQQCRQLYENGLPVSRIMTLLNIRSYSTVYRYLRQTGAYPEYDSEQPSASKLTKNELLKFKKEVYDNSHQLDLF